jgi:predicted RNA-binding protein with PIN domain
MLIVDTFNVLHAVPQVAPRAGELGGATIDGLARLIATGRWRSTEALLVCDGTGGGRARTGAAWGMGGVLVGRVRAVFAGPGKDADSSIEALLEDQEHRGAAHRCTVVSSDKRVKAAAAGVGVKQGRARWMSSQAFIVQLMEDAARAYRRDEQRSASLGRAGAEGLDPDSVAYWLAAFGFGGSGRGLTRDPSLLARPRAARPEVSVATPDPPVPARRGKGGMPRAGEGRGDAGAGGSGGVGPEILDLLEQIRQVWGPGVQPDDLDMEKWLGGRST